MTAGRPTTYSLELADAICERLANGESLRSVCRKEEFPAMSTVFKWLREIPEFSQQYVKAKEESADALVEDMLDIADDGTNDWMEQKNGDDEIIGWKLNGEHVQRSKLRVDVRKWAASKLKAKKYGDKITQEVSGIDGQPIQHTHGLSDATRVLLGEMRPKRNDSSS